MSVICKPYITLRRFIVIPKDKMHPRDGIYTIDCEGCEGKYVGDTNTTSALSPPTLLYTNPYISSNPHTTQDMSVELQYGQ